MPSIRKLLKGSTTISGTVCRALHNAAQREINNDAFAVRYIIDKCRFQISCWNRTP